MLTLLGYSSISYYCHKANISFADGKKTRFIFSCVYWKSLIETEASFFAMLLLFVNAELRTELGAVLFIDAIMLQQWGISLNRTGKTGT